MALILVMIVMSDIDVFNIGHAEHNDHHSYDHTHDPGVSSVSIVCEGSLDLEKVGVSVFTGGLYASFFITASRIIFQFFYILDLTYVSL